MAVVDHRLQDALFQESPNQDARPAEEISLIVLHGISLPAGQFGGDEVAQLFTNSLDVSDQRFAELDGVTVSAHLFIRRSGEVVQFVPFDRRAWHAGESSFYGRRRCNDFSIGIELEGADTVPYEDPQYATLAEVCGDLMGTYGIREITGHSNIAPGRKTDPGPVFDWLGLRRRLASRPVLARS